jgi:hypothetical protein
MTGKLIKDIVALLMVHLQPSTLNENQFWSRFVTVGSPEFLEENICGNGDVVDWRSSRRRVRQQ